MRLRHYFQASIAVILVLLNLNGFGGLAQTKSKAKAKTPVQERTIDPAKEYMERLAWQERVGQAQRIQDVAVRIETIARISGYVPDKHRDAVKEPFETVIDQGQAALQDEGKKQPTNRDRELMYRLENALTKAWGRYTIMFPNSREIPENLKSAAVLEAAAYLGGDLGVGKKEIEQLLSRFNFRLDYRNDVTGSNVILDLMSMHDEQGQVSDIAFLQLLHNTLREPPDLAIGNLILLQMYPFQGPYGGGGMSRVYLKKKAWPNFYPTGNGLRFEDGQAVADIFLEQAFAYLRAATTADPSLRYAALYNLYIKISVYRPDLKQACWAEMTALLPDFQKSPAPVEWLDPRPIPSFTEDLKRIENTKNPTEKDFTVLSVFSMIIAEKIELPTGTTKQDAIAKVLSHMSDGAIKTACGAVASLIEAAELLDKGQDSKAAEVMPKLSQPYPKAVLALSLADFYNQQKPQQGNKKSKAKDARVLERLKEALHYGIDAGPGMRNGMLLAKVAGLVQPLSSYEYRVALNGAVDALNNARGGEDEKVAFRAFPNQENLWGEAIAIDNPHFFMIINIPTPKNFKKSGWGWDSFTELPSDLPGRLREDVALGTVLILQAQNLRTKK